MLGGESEYRVRLGEEDVRQLAFQLADAMAGRAAGRRSFGELAEDWLKRLTRVQPKNERTHVRHLWLLHCFREPGDLERPDDLNKAAVDQCLLLLDKRSEGGLLGPAMLNKLRSTGKLIIDDAIANRRWRGANPFAATNVRRVPQKPHTRLRPEELAATFAQLRPDRRREALVALFTGMRPGELKALRKDRVDLERGFINVCASNGRQETKTGRAREVPIPDGCRKALVEAMKLSKSDLVFPRPDGSMQRADTKLSRTIRAAMVEAGVVSGYRYICRRKGCGFRLANVDSFQMCCPRCSMKLLRRGIAKQFTWYELRHCAATLHREAGADPHALKAALGWVSRDVGDDVYTHLSDERYRAEMNKLAVSKRNMYKAVRVDHPVPDASQARGRGFESLPPLFRGLGDSPLGPADVLCELSAAAATVMLKSESGAWVLFGTVSTPSPSDAVEQRHHPKGTV